MTRNFICVLIEVKLSAIIGQHVIAWGETVMAG